jgi:hypothetical protein
MEMYNYSTMTNEELLNLRKEIKNNISKYDNLQLAKKVSL